MCGSNQTKMVEAARKLNYEPILGPTDPDRPLAVPGIDFKHCPSCEHKTVIMFSHKEKPRLAGCGCGFRKKEGGKVEMPSSNNTCPCGCGDNVPSKRHTYAHGRVCSAKIKKGMVV